MSRTRLGASAPHITSPIACSRALKRGPDTAGQPQPTSTSLGDRRFKGGPRKVHPWRLRPTRVRPVRGAGPRVAGPLEGRPRHRHRCLGRTAVAANRRFYEQSGYSRAGSALITVVTRIREGRPRAQAAPLREARSTEREISHSRWRTKPPRSTLTTTARQVDDCSKSRKAGCAKPRRGQQITARGADEPRTSDARPAIRAYWIDSSARSEAR